MGLSGFVYMSPLFILIGDFKTANEMQQLIEDYCPLPRTTIIVDESMQPWYGPNWREQSLLSKCEWIKRLAEEKMIRIFILHSWTKLWACPVRTIEARCCFMIASFLNKTQPAELEEIKVVIKFDSKYEIIIVLSCVRSFTHWIYMTYQYQIWFQGLRIGSVIAPTLDDAVDLRKMQVPWSVNCPAIAFLDAVVRDTDVRRLQHHR